MQFPTQVEDFRDLAALQGPLHLAIGVFDGVHRGHRSVIELAVASARSAGGVSAVLTFDPHPSRLFRPEDPTLLMMSLQDKARSLHAMGVDIVIRKRFDRAFASIPAEDFLSTLKAALPSLTAVYVGENFRFGKKRAGDVATLEATGSGLGIAVFGVGRVKYAGEPISSTRIREALQAGAMGEVNELLGYNYLSSGTIVSGARLGRTIGFPTLNMPWLRECAPRFGVYCCRFRLSSGGPWSSAVANYGVKPTVAAAGADPVLELHALAPTELGEGAEVEVEWLHFIRAEQKFDSLDALKAQITEDCAKARALLHDA